MSDYSFIHASDLHLDSPFKSISHYPSSLKKTLVEAPLSAYKRLIEESIRRKVAFILMCGDIFDKETVSLRVQAEFINGLQKLSDERIKVFIIHGNHDQKFFTKIAKIIKNLTGVYIFGPNFERVELNEAKFNVDIYGASYSEDPTVIDKLKIIDSSALKIVCYHGEVAKSLSSKEYAGQLLSTLLRYPSDYWALGHLHEFNILNSFPHIVYSGTIQGRSFKKSECAEKGCALVNILNNKVEEVFALSLSAVAYYHLDINCIITEGNEIDLLNKLKEQIIEQVSQVQILSSKLILFRLNAKIHTNIKFSASTMLEIEDLLSNEDWQVNLNCSAKIVDYNWQFQASQRSEIGQEIVAKTLEILSRDLFFNDEELQNELFKPLVKMRLLESEPKEEIIDHVIDKIRQIVIG